MPLRFAQAGFGAGDLFDDSGAIKKPETKQFVDKFLAAFAAWIERVAARPAA